jgi:hypothetical protein
LSSTIQPNCEEVARNLLAWANEDSAAAAELPGMIDAWTAVLLRHPDWVHMQEQISLAIEAMDLAEMFRLSNMFASDADRQAVLVGMIAAELRLRMGELA